nr:hypothetical protein [Tanacetum cinerariifolium]
MRKEDAATWDGGKVTWGGRDVAFGTVPLLIIPPKSAPMTQAAIRRMIKDNVDAAIAAERASQANVRNDASGSRPARGQHAAPAVRECTFVGFMKYNPAVFRGVEGAVKLQRCKSEVTSSKPTNLNEVVGMAHKLMEPKSQARDARILEGKKQK